MSVGDLRKKWAPQGMEVVDATPQQIEKMIRDEYERMGKLIKQTGIRLKWQDQVLASPFAIGDIERLR